MELVKRQNNGINPRKREQEDGGKVTRERCNAGERKKRIIKGRLI